MSPPRRVAEHTAVSGRRGGDTQAGAHNVVSALSEPVSGLSGYDCYDDEHVDGHKGTTGASKPGQVLYLVSDDPELPAQEAASYREVRGNPRSSVNPAMAMPWLFTLKGHVP